MRRERFVRGGKIHGKNYIHSRKGNCQEIELDAFDRYLLQSLIAFAVEYGCDGEANRNMIP